MKHIKIFLALIFFICICASCGLFINRTDRHGERHGKWKHYWDKKIVQRKGKYRHGLEVGTWKYFDLKGILTKKEEYNQARYTIFTTTYYPDKKIESKGNACLLEEPGNSLHYYWQGEWLYFDESGSIMRREWYEKGVMVRKADQ